MLVDQLCNETAFLRLFYEIRQKYRCLRIPLRRPDRLLNGGELAALYSFGFLYLAAAGPGPWSVDAKRTQG